MNFLNKQTKNIAFVIVVLLVFTTSIFSQNNIKASKSNFWEHVRFGGGLGLSFGDGFTSITVAPSAIYQFNNSFSVGLGLNGTYNSRKNFYNSTILGGSILTLFNPVREIQLSAEFEELNVNRKFDNSLSTKDQSYWYPALFLGAGYRTGNVTFGIRYDVLYDEDDSIYADPWIPFLRVYF